MVLLRRNPRGTGCQPAPGKEELFRQACQELNIAIRETRSGPRTYVGGDRLAGKIAAKMQEIAKQKFDAARSRDIERAIRRAKNRRRAGGDHTTFADQ